MLASAFVMSLANASLNGRVFSSEMLRRDRDDSPEADDDPSPPSGDVAKKRRRVRITQSCTQFRPLLPALRSCPLAYLMLRSLRVRCKKRKVKCDRRTPCVRAYVSKLSADC